MTEPQSGEAPLAPTRADAPRRSASWRSLGLLALLALVAGGALGIWGYQRWWVDPAADAPAAASLADDPARDLSPLAAAPAAVAEVPFAPTGNAAVPDPSSGLDGRVAELERRLGTINAQAASASGNAARAEGLLVAFAVRRALDRGLALGYLDAQLRLRFGDDQPNAVKTIVDTARKPVTLEKLRAELDRIAPQLIGRSGGDGGLWTGFRRELSELFVVRSASEPSQRAQDRLERARRLVDAGMIDAAIAEVSAMPGAAAADQWLVDARRYHEARRALDLIETAAILEPRVGETTGSGATVPVPTN